MRRLAPLLLVACSFTATKDPLSYEDLSPGQKSAVDRINENLQEIHDAFDAQGGPGIDKILGQAEVGFEGILTAVNLGDQRARISVWEDLSDKQRDLVAGWWQVSLPEAEAIYPFVLYDYMALHLGAQEYIYEVQGVERVFENRPRLKVDLDAARLVAAYARANWPAVMDPLAQVCVPMRQQYDAVWGDRYGIEKEHQRWFQQNLEDLADPEEPTGYFYFLCRWTEDGRARSFTLAEEMQKIKDRFGYP